MGFNLGTLATLVGTVAGAGILAKIFFSVGKMERGVLYRLGKPVYKKVKGKKRQIYIKLPLLPRFKLPIIYRRDKSEGTERRIRVLIPGRPGTWVPFIWKLLKISVAIRVRQTEDIELMRLASPDTMVREAWICKAEMNYRAQTSRRSLDRAMTRANDLDETVKSAVQDAIRQVLYENPVGTLESSRDIEMAVKENCKSRLMTLGVSLSRINVYKLRQADATIMANALRENAGVDLKTIAALTHRFQ